MMTDRQAIAAVIRYDKSMIKRLQKQVKIAQYQLAMLDWREAGSPPDKQPRFPK